MKVAVLGCGPSGLVAAHAALSAGADVTVYSRKRRSHIFGAQYLHAPIPGISHDFPITIEYKLRGEVSEYRRKVYGMHGLETEVSPETMKPFHEAWDLRRAYGILYLSWESEIVDTILRPGVIRSIIIDHDLTISTIPANVLCGDMSHYFHSTEVWAVGDAPELGARVPAVYTVPEGQVVCTGLREDNWYRSSNIFGHCTTEWPSREAALRDGIVARGGFVEGALVPKPIGTTCDCWTEYPGFMRAGRYGMWKKGVLVHNVYDQILHALEMVA